MDLTALEGRVFGPYELRVCLEKVREFIDVTGGDPDRWITAAPPGYLAAPLFVVAPDLLNQLSGFSVIHGEQVFTWAQPMLMEKDHSVTGTVTRVRERAGSYFVGFEMAVSDGADEVATGSSLFLVTPAAAPQESDGREETAPLDRGDPGVGQLSASRSDLVRYAAATRDWNPIHWDHRSATAAGLPGVVVHGLLQTAWALSVATEDVEGDLPLASAKIRFRNPLLTAHPVDIDVATVDGRRTVIVSDGNTQFLTAQIDLAQG